MHLLEAVRTEYMIFTNWVLHKNMENRKNCLWKVVIKTIIRESKTVGFGFGEFDGVFWGVQVKGLTLRA